MNKKYISEFKEKESIKTELLIKAVTNGVTTTGAPYLSITLQDKSGTIEGKIWDVKPEQAEQISCGRIGLVNAEVLMYRNSLQLRIHSISLVDEKGIDYGDFVPESPIPKNKLKDKIELTIKSLDNEVLYQLVSTIINEIGDMFYQYPAAAKNHHNMVAGLATHTCGMLDIGAALCELYPQLNRDLLFAGIILHDVGKLEELSGPIITEYTLKGKLIGHISLVQAMIASTAEKLNLQDEEYTILLRHMVLSHHGEYEYGSPVLPMIQEAEVLNFIDNLDARLNMLDKSLSQTEAGKFTSRIFSLENRAFYKPSH